LGGGGGGENGQESERGKLDSHCGLSLGRLCDFLV
jgi:hypothetical protein